MLGKYGPNLTTGGLDPHRVVAATTKLGRQRWSLSLDQRCPTPIVAIRCAPPVLALSPPARTESASCSCSYPPQIPSIVTTFAPNSCKGTSGSDGVVQRRQLLAGLLVARSFHYGQRRPSIVAFEFRYQSGNRTCRWSKVRIAGLDLAAGGTVLAWRFWSNGPGCRGRRSTCGRRDYVP